VHRAQRRSAGEQEHIGIGTITAGMLGLLAFTLSLTINIAQNRYEARRGLVLQEANSVQAAWLRSKLIGGERGPPVTAMIEKFAKVQLAYVSTDRLEDEAGLIARKTALEAQIWQAMQVLSHEQPTNATSGLVLALTEMFGCRAGGAVCFCQPGAGQHDMDVDGRVGAGDRRTGLPSEGVGEPAYRADIAPASHVGGQHRADCRPQSPADRGNQSGSCTAELDH
jgi:hypothetical protein